jgi:hypothetical protein
MRTMFFLLPDLLKIKIWRSRHDQSSVIATTNVHCYGLNLEKMRSSATFLTSTTKYTELGTNNKAILSGGVCMYYA